MIKKNKCLCETVSATGLPWVFELLALGHALSVSPIDNLLVLAPASIWSILQTQRPTNYCVFSFPVELCVSVEGNIPGLWSSPCLCGGQVRGRAEGRAPCLRRGSQSSSSSPHPPNDSSSPVTPSPESWAFDQGTLSVWGGDRGQEKTMKISLGGRKRERDDAKVMD